MKKTQTEAIKRLTGRIDNLREQNAALLELLRWLAHEASLADEFTYTKKMSEVDEAIRKAKERT